jgi:hypothetical protein
MPRTHSIEFPAAEGVAVLRESFLAICEGKHCPAMILSQMMYWHDVKRDAAEQAAKQNEIAERGGEAPAQDVECWVYKTGAEMQKELMGLFGEKAIAAGFLYLEQRGFLRVRSNPRYPWDRTKQYLFDAAEVRNAFRKIAECIPQDRAIDSAETTVSNPQDRGLITETTPETYTKTTQTLNVGGPDTYDKLMEPIRQIVALTGDTGSERRFVQLWEIASEAGRSSAWDEAERSLRKRLGRKSLGELEKPGAYFCKTLAAILEKYGIPVPVGTPEERASVNAEIRESMGL